MIPLTHHDVVRVAAPLVRAGLRIDAAATERARRRIVFRPHGASDDGALHALHTLTVLAGGEVELARAVAHAPSGLVSTLVASADDAEALIETFRRIPPTRQIVREGDVVAAESWTLEPNDERGGSGARLALQQVVGRAGPLFLIVDVSTGAGMPADVLLAARADWTDHLRETLASGATVPQRQTAAQLLLATLPVAPADGAEPEAPLAALPDDVLAVLGPSWRPLVWQGTRWKGVLRLLGRDPERGERASRRVRDALHHLTGVLSETPRRYHARHAAARRRVFLRRLRPAMALLAILAVMPLSWLFVARGGVEMHPLALGLTPLLMVGVVLLSAREIPVLEIPPLPRPLPDERWRPIPRAPSSGAGASDTSTPPEDTPSAVADALPADANEEALR